VKLVRFKADDGHGSDPIKQNTERRVIV